MESFFKAFRQEIKITVEEAVGKALEKQLPSIVRKATLKQYLTKKELMELTGWSARQVEYKKSKREIPFVRNGRLVLFPTEEVYQFLDQGYVPVRKKDRAGG